MPAVGSGNFNQGGSRRGRSKVRRSPSLRPEAAGNPNVSGAPRAPRPASGRPSTAGNPSVGGTYRAPRRPVSRPAPARQPGPVSDRERGRTERFKRSPGYQRSLVRTQREALRNGSSPLLQRAVAGDQRLARALVTQGLVSPEHLRQARIAYLRSHRLTGTALVDDLLNRRLPKLANAIGDAWARNQQVSTGGGPVIARLGAEKLTGKSSAGPIATLTAPRPVSFDDKFGHRFMRDLANYVLMAPSTIWQGGSAAAGLATGHPDRAVDLAKGVASGVIGHALRGDFKGAERVMEEHPLFGLLELRGAKAVVGRGAGAAMRSGALGSGARQAASTSRADRSGAGAAGGRAAVRQHYSPDVLTKLGQVALERATGPRGVSDRDLRRMGDFLADQAQSSARLRREREGAAAVRAQPVRHGQQRAGARAPERAARAVARGVERSLPSGTGRFGSRVLPKGVTRPERDVVSLVMRRVVRNGDARTFKADLQKELGRLDSEFRKGGFRSASEKRANRTQARAIERVLADPRALANARGIASSADELVRRTNSLEGRAIEQRALNPESAERSKLFEYAQAHMDAKWSKADGLHVERQVDGKVVARPLSNAAIVAHMRKHGVPFEDGKPLVAYLPNRPDVRGARAYYQSAFTGSRRNLDREAKTGRSFEKGLHDSSYAQPTEHLTRLSGVLGRIEEHDQLVHDVGVRRPDGSQFTWDEAQVFAENAAEIPGQARLVPYRAAPGRYDADRLRSIVEEQDASKAPEFEKLMEKDFADRLIAPTGSSRKARNVVLIPETLAQRLTEHGHVTTNLGRLGNMFTHAFRGAVLPFSPKWLVGNDAEAALRLAAVGAGPNSLRIGHHLLRAMATLDADKAARVEAALVGGMQFGQKNLEVFRTSEMLTGGLAKPGKVASLIGRAPIVSQVRAGLKTYQKAVFDLNRAIEREAQVAALGKWARREMQEMTGSWGKALRAQEGALEDVARGLFETKNQMDAARYLDETLGKYSRFSPELRRFTQSVAPFLPWYLNSIRFVFWTLPGKHPIKTALLVTLEASMQQEFAAQHKNVPPGSLRSAVPFKGGLLDVGRYVPFGVATEVAGGGNALQTALDPLLPQVASIAKAAYGLSFTGRPARVSAGGRKPDGQISQGTEMLMALSAALEAFAPGASIVRRAQEGGKTPYDDSFVWSPKTKPGPARSSALDRILNPLRPTYLTGGQPEPVEPPSPTGAASGTAASGVQQALQARAAAAGSSGVSPAIAQALASRAGVQSAPGSSDAIQKALRARAGQP